MATFKIEFVDEQLSEMVVTWNEDKRFSWNYFVPKDEAGVPLTGDALKQWAAQLGYDTIKRQEQMSLAGPAQSLVDFKKKHEGELFDISTEIAELNVIAQLRQEEEEALAALQAELEEQPVA